MLTISTAFTQVTIGIVITINGIWGPYQVFGAALTTIGVGLLFTLKVNSNPGHWIGYQLLSGIGLGMCFNVPLIVTQRVVKAMDVSTATAVILFFQSLGGSLIVSAGQSIFQNELVKKLVSINPEISSLSVASADATTLRRLFSHEQMSGILESYVHGLSSAFVLAIPVATLAAVVSCVPKWGRLVASGHGATASLENDVESEPKA